MPTFYCIHDGYYKGIAERIQSIKDACLIRSISFVDLDSQTIDFTQLLPLIKGDMLYNVARGGEVLETLLLGPDVKSFYIQNPLLIENNSDTIKYSLVHDKLSLPTPKTIFKNVAKKESLKRSIDHLGGFPVVIKISGGTKGIGTVIVSDYPSFYSITDLLFSQKSSFILREYIHPVEIARLIVVGNEVVASNKKLVPEDDFRSSVDHDLPIPKKYDDRIEKVAITAAHSANMTNCGVDILIDKFNNPFVLEVNMPHDFVTTEEATGIDISGKMIDYLFGI